MCNHTVQIQHWKSKRRSLLLLLLFVDWKGLSLHARWCECSFDQIYLYLLSLSDHIPGGVAGVSQETSCWHVSISFKSKAPRNAGDLARCRIPPDVCVCFPATSNAICCPTKRAKAKGRPSSRGTRSTPSTTRLWRWCRFSVLLVLLTRRARRKQWPHPQGPQDWYLHSRLKQLCQILVLVSYRSIEPRHGNTLPQRKLEGWRDLFERDCFLMVEFKKSRCWQRALIFHHHLHHPTVLPQPLPAAQSLYPDLSVASWSPQPQHLPGRGADSAGQQRPRFSRLGPSGTRGKGRSVLYCRSKKNVSLS